MASKGRKKITKPRLMLSFRYAIQGIGQVLKTERNFQIHICVSILVVLAGLYFQIKATDWIFLIIVIGGVLSLELMNTAIEKTVDLVTKEYQTLAKLAKDASAGAVFVYTIVSIIIGCIVFGKYIFIIKFVQWKSCCL